MDKVELIKKIKAGMEFEYLFFWENQPSKRGSVGESCLSQWFPAEFTVDGYCLSLRRAIYDGRESSIFQRQRNN